MSIFLKRLINCSAALLVGIVIGNAVQADAAEGGPEIARQEWTFGGITGYFDNDQLRRGYMVYKNVCSSCHGLRLLHYRNLMEPGGPEYSNSSVTDFAAEAQVTDGPNDDGEMFTRPGKPSDRFVSPYPNDKAAAAAQGGTVPPDLSLIVKARTIERHSAWYAAPYFWVSDIVTVYQEQGADYLYALLTGYQDAPQGIEMVEGMNYNAAFPGHQIAMPAPLAEGLVEYPEGIAPTVDNYARDVTAFLAWAAEPKLEQRKRLGVQVMFYLLILAVLAYLSKLVIWRKVKH